MIEKSTLQERKDRLEQKTGNSIWAINKDHEEGELPTTALRSLALEALEIAGCELQLGNVDAARQWFARATYADRSYIDVFAGHYDELPTSTQNDGRVRALYAIQDAILAGDARLIETTAQEVLALSDYPYEYLGTGEMYYKGCVLSALATGDVTAAQQYRDYCADAIEEVDEYLDALLQTYDALFEDEPAAVQTGLQTMVNYHAEYIDDHHADSTDDLARWLEVMSPAVGALFLLARDRGMDITIDSWYLPDGLTTYGLTDQIDLPRPDYLREELLVEE